ncbi:hypothetical protein QR680_013946 [Steinernema hermaphroditum]|uniref:DNA2/NAM7 helicase-like C-terminal domain-containing protein n=1 Tax=Steinernema hermaphroditum TaxID=289476 RepID=A0AA39M333_9BILA|nr:hypothetical protein QR680_013946 [Steinernema hermaphroditum]
MMFRFVIFVTFLALCEAGYYKSYGSGDSNTAAAAGNGNSGGYYHAYGSGNNNYGTGSGGNVGNGYCQDKTIVTCSQQFCNDPRIDYQTKYWLCPTTCNLYERPKFVRVRHNYEKVGNSVRNIGHVHAIRQYLRRFTDEEKQNIAIITPYTAQKMLLSSQFKDVGRVNTIDEFQGDEADTIIISLPRRNLAFLHDTYSDVYNDMVNPRLVVMLTRARKEMILFGDDFQSEAKNFQPSINNFLETVETSWCHIRQYLRRFTDEEKQNIATAQKMLLSSQFKDVGRVNTIDEFQGDDSVGIQIRTSILLWVLRGLMPNIVSYFWILVRQDDAPILRSTTQAQ